MKRIKFWQLLVALSVVTTIFNSCEDDDNQIVDEKTQGNNLVYIINYGSYSGAKSEIDVYNEDSAEISHNAFFSANGFSYGSNIQSVGMVDSIMYCMGNNGDKIDILNINTMLSVAEPISAGITKPRAIVFNDTLAYVSCWGNADWNKMEDSYIAIINLKTNTLVDSIKLDGGPEGLYIKNNKLYACFEFKKQLAVVDLTTKAVSYINLPAVSMYIDEDANGKLWVSVVNSYSNPAIADSVGLVIIDPASNKRVGFVNVPGIGSNGYFTANKLNDMFYVMGNDVYPGTNAYVYAVSVNTPVTPTSALITGENFYGMTFNKKSDKLYILVSPSTSENGTLKVYSTTGTLLDTQTTGVGPLNVVFY